MFLVSFNTDIPYLLIPLFVLRAVGNLLFLIKQERKIFLYTPNIFENVFLAYFILLKFFDLNIGEDQTALIITFAVSAILKIIQEFLVHWKAVFPFAPVYKYFGKENYNK